MKPIKHKYRRLAVGGSHEVTNPPKWFRTAVYKFGVQAGRYFSVCQTGNGSVLVTRHAKPLTAEQISQAKSDGAKIMHARLKAQRSDV